MTPEDIAQLRGDIETMLKDKNCKDFIDKLVKKGLEQNSGSSLEDSDILKVPAGGNLTDNFYNAGIFDNLLNAACGPTKSGGTKK